MSIKNFFNKKSVLISLPVLLLACYSFFQNYKLKKVNEEHIAVQKALSVYKDKNFVLQEVIDQVKTDKNILYEEVIKEKEMNSIFSNMEFELSNSKKQISDLQSVTEELNQKLQSSKNSNLELFNLNQQILKHAEDVLNAQSINQKLSEKILSENFGLISRFEKEKGSLLKFQNLKSHAYFLSSNSKQIYSYRSSDINFIEVNFKILNNPFFNSSYLDVYIQVIDPDGNVLLDNKIKENNENQFNYTNYSRVFYNNLDLNVSQNIFIKHTKPGVHYVNVIYRNNIVLTDKLILK